MFGLKRGAAFADPAALFPAPAPSSPFVRARQQWDDREGALVKRLANWQRTCGGLTIAGVVLSGGLVITAKNTKVLPYVIEVADTGQVKTVGGLPQPWHGQVSAPLRYAVTEWLERLRTIGTDPILFERQWAKAKDFMAHKAIQVATPWMKGQWERHTKGITVQIQLTSLLPITPDFRAVAVEWIEKTYSQQGQLTSTDTWKAIINLAVYPPTELTTPTELRNPLGIFVVSYDWNKKPTINHPGDPR